MSKAIDLGKSLDDMVSVHSISPSDKHYPDLYISDSDDPRIADLPDKGECTIKYRVVSRTHREEKNGDGKKKHSCCVRLEVLSITPPGKSKSNGTYGDDARKSMGEFFKDK